MSRMLAVVCATLTMMGLSLTASPATAYVGDYSFSNRDGAERAASSQRRAARGSRAASRRTAASAIDDGDRPARRSRRGGKMSSIAGGSGSGGIASYYWQRQRVASGGWFNPSAYTAAHKTLPFGTRVRVTNMNNGRSVVVSINDRGPYVRGRVIDLSRAAAQAVGMVGSGLARVSLAVLGR